MIMKKYMYKSKKTGVYRQHDIAPSLIECNSAPYSNPKVEAAETESIRLFKKASSLMKIIAK
jgi:hypothetical protein